MFGIPLVSWVIIACIAALALSMVPASVWASLKPKATAPEVGPLPLPLRPNSPADIASQAPQKYLAVQKMLLDARTACGECPEAITAIDAAIRATVAMVVQSKPGYSVTIANDWEPFVKATVTAVAPEVAPEVKQ